MKNLKKFFNSMKGKMSIGIACLLILIAAIVMIFIFKSNTENVTNIGISGDSNVGFDEDKNVEMTSDIKKLSEDFYDINREEGKVYVAADYVKSIVLSDNPDGPTGDDVWVNRNEEGNFDVEEGEIKKQYVYYLAGTVSSFSSYSSSADYFTISSNSELDAFRTRVNSGTTFSGKEIYLMADLTLTSTNHVCIGTTSKPFKGTFNGNGHSISNIKINRPSSSTSETGYQGLFGYATGATVKNLTITGSTIIAGSSTGAIAGYLDGDVENCIISNTTITGGSNVGGLIGSYGGGTIKNCQNYSNVHGERILATGMIGGIVGGIHSKAVFFNCKNEGDISTTGYGIGGIAGATYDGGTPGSVDMSYCTNSGSITTSATAPEGDEATPSIGGIIGLININDTASHSIKNCKNTGTVTSASYSVGGILGQIHEKNVLEIEYCINEGEISTSGRGNVGGIAGAIWGTTATVEHCFNSGNITTTSSHCANFGGILGYGLFTNNGSIGINYCGNTGNVTAPTYNSTVEDGYNSNVGGMVGRLDKNGTITYCYNTGDLTAYRTVAGIAHLLYTGNTVTNCYSKGKITSTVTKQNAGIAIVHSSSFYNSTMTATNNYFYGTYNDTDTNALYVSLYSINSDRNGYDR